MIQVFKLRPYKKISVSGNGSEKFRYGRHTHTFFFFFFFQDTYVQKD